jgi:oxygen-independent coproporphyrinogen-3 oxidase
VRTGDAERHQRYVEHLLLEIERQDPEGWKFDTIYFGGGTPSCLNEDQLSAILEALRSRFEMVERPWILFEANPEDVSEASIESWKRLDVRTLSLGVQSFDDAELQFLGRAHDGDGARRASTMIRDAGFETFSLDLIYGLPKQTEDAWRHGIDAALEVAPDHLSCYQLTIHDGTRFALLERRGELTQLDEGGQADLFHAAHSHLNAAGYAGYEVSQFARERRFRSPHNQKYWNHTPYLGLGPSAHSYREDRRWWNIKKADDWQRALAEGRSPVESTERLSRDDLILETLMTGFRTYHGVDLGQLSERFEIDLAATNRERIARLVDSGMVKRFERRLVPTLDGLAVADSLATMFRF